MLIARDATKRKAEVLAIAVRWVNIRTIQKRVVAARTRVNSCRPPVTVGALIVQLTIIPMEAT